MLDSGIIKEFGIKVIAPSLVVFGLICYLYEDIVTKILENNILFFIIFLPIIGAVYLSKEIFLFLFEKWKLYQMEESKKLVIQNRIRQSIDDFYKLEEDKRKIIWNIFHRDNEGFYQYEVNDLIDNYYLDITTKMKKKDLGFVIVKLNDQIENFLKKEFIKIFSSLDDNEKFVIEMFFEKINDDEYKHPWIEKEVYNSLSQLHNKNVIFYETNQYIQLKERMLENIKSYSGDELQREKIYLDLEQIAPTFLTQFKVNL